jgi:hypothetical protein
MDDAQLQVLNILINTNKTLFEAKKSNKSRINNFIGLTNDARNSLINISINSLDAPLDLLYKKIKQTISFIPEYYDCLEHIDGISIYDAGELIVLIKDINRFKNKNSFIYYCGLSPVNKMGNSYQKITKKNKQYGEIIGNPKQDTSKIQYNDRLNKVILKVVKKLIKYNPEYKQMYNEYFDKYLFKHSNYTMKHIKYMTQRKIAVKFARFLYTEFYKIENGEQYD